MVFDEQPDGDPHGECAAEIHRLEQQLDAIEAALGGGTAYMDPPDGGAPTLAERVARMGADAARYRALRATIVDEEAAQALFDAVPADGAAWTPEALDAMLDKLVADGLI